jgi:hypothetical protein
MPPLHLGRRLGCERLEDRTLPSGAALADALPLPAPPTAPAVLGSLLGVLTPPTDPSAGTVLPTAARNPVCGVPLVADLTGDGVPDVTILSHDGRILFRQGEPDAPGLFAPPVVINPAPSPGTPGVDHPACALALVRCPSGFELAALEAGDAQVDLYHYEPATGLFVRSAGPVVPTGQPVCLAAADLFGSGRDDLVVAADPDQVFIYRQGPDGSFGSAPAASAEVGAGPSAVTVADVDGNALPDVVVTGQLSGDLTVLYNDPSTPFASTRHFPIGAGPFGPSGLSPDPLPASTPVSLDRPVALAVSTPGAGEAQAGPTAPSLAVLDAGTGTVEVLRGSGAGLYAPDAALSIPVGGQANALVAAQLDGSPTPYLAVLDPGRQEVLVFRGEGGAFTLHTTVALPNAASPPPGGVEGNAPMGLALQDVGEGGRHRLDLLVGNADGSVLRLPGHGDGTFGPYRRLDEGVAMAVGNGRAGSDFIFADRSRDQLSVQYAGGERDVLAANSSGLQAPGAVALADLNGDGIADLVVANSGGNNVLVYPGLPDGTFGPEVNGGKGFVTGSNPAGVTVADVNGDGIPDLVVADEGSNDVRVLLGQGRGASWTLVPGPRFQVGQGPTSALVADLSGTGTPNLVVSNSGDNSVSVLPGGSPSFFDDQHPRVLSTGADPRQVLVGDYTGNGKLDLVSVNAGSNDLTFYADVANPASKGVSVPSGGQLPVAALPANVNGAAGLVVANEADGRVTVLVGGPEGLHLARTLATGLHPGALAEATSGSSPQVYAVDAGSGTVELLTLAPAEVATTAAPAPVEPVPAFDGTAGSDADSGARRPTAADLQPLTPATVAVVPTVVAGAESAEERGARPAEEGPPHSSPAPPSSSASAGRPGSPEEAGPEGEPGASATGGAPTSPPMAMGGLQGRSVTRMVLGVDEAVQQEAPPGPGLLGPERGAAEAGEAQGDSPVLPGLGARPAVAGPRLSAAEAASPDALPRPAALGPVGPAPEPDPWLVRDAALALLLERPQTAEAPCPPCPPRPRAQEPAAPAASALGLLLTLVFLAPILTGERTEETHSRPDEAASFFTSWIWPAW